MKEASSFISTKLKNYQSTFDNSNNNSSTVLDLAKNLYHELNQSQLDLVAIEEIRNECHKYRDRDSVVEYLHKVKKNEVQYRKLFKEVYFSLWWKISWPLRKTEKLCHI